MSNPGLELLLHYANDLQARTVKQGIEKVATQSAISFGKELRGMVGNTALKLTPNQAQALQRNISIGSGVIERQKDGVRINLRLKESAKSDPSNVSKWARSINVGGKILPKNSKYLAIPFSQGPFKIVSFAKGTSDASIVGKFVKSFVEKKDGQPLLKNTKNASGSLIMSGKIVGRGEGWQPIATLVKEIKIPETRWADTFLYNIVRSLTETV